VSIRSVTAATPDSTARHCSPVKRRADPVAVVEASPGTGDSACPAVSARTPVQPDQEVLPGQLCRRHPDQQLTGTESPVALLDRAHRHVQQPDYVQPVQQLGDRDQTAVAGPTSPARRRTAKHAAERNHPMRPDNSHHLVAAAQRRRADTLQRARQALQELDETGQRHTIMQIAAHAGVSRSWLYAQPELRDQLRRLTAISETPEPAPPARIERGSDASLRQRLTLAHERIRELDDENHQLRNQIALLHGHLRANRIAGTHVTDTVHDTNPQLTPLSSQPSSR
jgi:hypothetical protein